LDADSALGSRRHGRLAAWSPASDCRLANQQLPVCDAFMSLRLRKGSFSP
jgi:hypothetical protein